MRISWAVVLGVLLGASTARAQDAPPPQQPAAPGVQEAVPPPPPAPLPPPPQQGYPPRPPSYGYPPSGYGTPPSGYGAYPAAPGYYPPPPSAPARIYRSGLVLGFALGGGAIRFPDEGENGFAYSFNIGGMLNSNVALLFDASGLSHAVGYGEDESHTIFGGALRLFLLRFLWAQAGVGFGHIAVSDAWGYTAESTETSAAFIAAVGAEVLQTTGGFTLDLQLRAAGARYEGIGGVVNTSLMLGFNFY